MGITLDLSARSVLSGPFIVTRGFIYVKESEEFIDESQNVVMEAVEAAFAKKGKTDVNAMRNIIRDALRDLVWKRMKRNPVILPMVMDVGI